MCDKVKSTFGFARPENQEESLTLYDRNETALPAHAKIRKEGRAHFHSLAPNVAPAES